MRPSCAEMSNAEKHRFQRSYQKLGDSCGSVHCENCFHDEVPGLPRTTHYQCRHGSRDEADEVRGDHGYSPGGRDEGPDDHDEVPADRDDHDDHDEVPVDHDEVPGYAYDWLGSVDRSKPGIAPCLLEESVRHSQGRTSPVRIDDEDLG